MSNLRDLPSGERTFESSWSWTCRMKRRRVTSAIDATSQSDRGRPLPGSRSGGNRTCAVTRSEHHQRSHNVGALHVADVSTFDPQWRVSQTERLLNILQRSGSGSEVAARFSLCRCNASLALRCTVSARSRLSPRRGTRRVIREPHRRTARWSAPPRRGRHGTKTSRGTGLVDSSAARRIRPGRRRTESGTARQVAPHRDRRDHRAFDDPAALAANPPAATSDTWTAASRSSSAKAITSVGTVTEDHRLLLHSPSQRTEVVA